MTLQAIGSWSYYVHQWVWLCHLSYCYRWRFGPILVLPGKEWMCFRSLHALNSLLHYICSMLLILAEKSSKAMEVLYWKEQVWRACSESEYLIGWSRAQACMHHGIREESWGWRWPYYYSVSKTKLLWFRTNFIGAPSGVWGRIKIQLSSPRSASIGLCACWKSRWHQERKSNGIPYTGGITVWLWKYTSCPLFFSCTSSCD